MKTDTVTWKLYKLLFLDIWHHQFFHSHIKPQQEVLTSQQQKDYVTELAIEVKGYRDEKDVYFAATQPLTLFYADHPSSLDALWMYLFLQKVDPVFVSFLHNALHFKFLEDRMIPVSAFFKASQWNLLGFKMRFAKDIEDLTEKQAHEMNSQVVPAVVKTLAQERSVIIFPSGGWGEWQDGIGFIIDQFHTTYPDRPLVLQSLKIKSFREIHSVLHSLLHWLGIRVSGTVKISVGSPVTIQDFITSHPTIFSMTDTKERAKAIKKQLEDEYHRL